MVASTRPALAAVLVSSLALGGGIVAWHRAGDRPAGSALGVEAPIPAGFSPREARIIRAGVFQMPVLGLDQLTAVVPGSRPIAAALTIATPFGDLDGGAEPEVPGDPVRDGMKAGADAFPSIDRSLKADLAMTRLPAGIAETASEPEPEPETGSGFQAADPFLPDEGAPPLARLSRQLSPPAAGSLLQSFKPTRLDAALSAAIAERLHFAGPETGGDDGAVPVDHSLAPTGGTSPAASRPDLAGLDTRTTGAADAPLELAAAPSEPTVRMASVHPTDESDAGAPMPILTPEEGLTTAQKNARIAGLPGLDDGMARPLTLPPVAFTRAQTCLATAIYFEARGESDTGRIAVAQVVVNRVRSPFYPKNVCDVVYQGASNRRYGGCQFSFACDLVADRITEPQPWKEALDIAQRVLDAQDWLPELGNATHYHANYVRPRWVRDMVRKDRIGKHIFYRVRGWA